MWRDGRGSGSEEGPGRCPNLLVPTVCGILLLSCFTGSLAAQELQPRAYIPAPVGLNFVTFGYARNAGGLLYEGAMPLDDAHASANVVSTGFGQTLAFLGRTVQILAVLSYVQADLSAVYAGAGAYRYRSGMADAVFRYSMNIHGAPAMTREEFAKYRQKTIVGASVTVSAPTGQYDPNVLINIGTNRWGFKPEIGVSRAIGKWTLEGAAGVWLYSANHQYNGQLVSTQMALGSTQAHVVRLLPHRIWLAFDGTYYNGGRTNVAGADRANYIGNSRLGATFGISLKPRHAVKISYFGGAIARFGSDTQSLGITYTIVWQKGH